VATGFSFGFLDAEDETYRLSRNVGKKLPILAALEPGRTQFSSFISFEVEDHVI